MTEDICSQEGCERQSKFIGCAHILAGEVKDISVAGNAVSCEACEKLKPDDSFKPICGWCLELLKAPEDPEGELEKEEAEDAEDRKIEEEAQARRHHREMKKKELQRIVSVNTVEKFFAALVDLIKDFLPGGYIYKKYENIQALWAKIAKNDSSWPNSLSTDEYNIVLGGEHEFLREQVRGGSFSKLASLGESFLRLFKNKSDKNPVYEKFE